MQSSVQTFEHRLIPRLRYCPDAKSLLIFGLVATFLLFVRIAVLWAPAYSYQGPTGADRVFYYAYVRSLVIDRDLDLSNEIAMHPPSSGLIIRDGKPLNKYPIGSPLLSLPLYALTHVLVLGGNNVGLTHVAADGYSAPYAFAYCLSQLLWALFGVWLMYRALLRYFDSQTAAVAVVATWFCTHAIHYAAVDLMMSHAAAIFSIAWCSYGAVRLAESPGRWQSWFAAGASSALVVLVRYQNGVYLIVPAYAALAAVARLLKSTSVRHSVGLACIGAAGLCLVFAPQMVVWRLIFGSWLTNSYQTEFRFNWLHPHLLEVLFNPTTGLAIWLPALSLGMVGCFALAIRRRDMLAAAAGAAWLANLYVISCWWAWQSIVHRSAFDMLFPICLGFGFTISWFWRKWPTVTLIVVSLLVIWTLPFVLVPRPSAFAAESPLSVWLDCSRILLRLKHG